MEADQTSTDVPSCRGCVERDRRIAQLERQNAQLATRLKQLEQRLEELSRSAKRQAAPFSRGLPELNPKRPGRKSGEDYGTKAFRVVPSVIDEEYDAPLPRRCPRCGGSQFIDTRVDHQYQVEIPRRPIYRRFNVAVAHCTGCGKRVQGRHPLQTSDALGCCASQVGPEAQAAVVMLNKELGLSQGKISRFFRMFFGITLTRGGELPDHAAGRRAVPEQLPGDREAGATGPMDRARRDGMADWGMAGVDARGGGPGRRGVPDRASTRLRGVGAADRQGLRREAGPRRLGELRPLLACDAPDLPGPPAAALP
jgi:transposase